MQLMIEVLPAPLGPMIENSSPSLTPKLTSVSARTPPKRSDTPRTSKVWANLIPPRYGAWRALYPSFAVTARDLIAAVTGRPFYQGCFVPRLTPDVTPHPLLRPLSPLCRR